MEPYAVQPARRRNGRGVDSVPTRASCRVRHDTRRSRGIPATPLPDPAPCAGGGVGPAAGSEHEAGMANHQRFHETLASGDHRILAAGPLEQSAAAISMRNTRRGSATVTEGPFTESAEQIVGFFLIESGDEPALLEALREFAEGGDHVEFRRLMTD
ncbi:MAG: YciI family protein [Nocardioides sp.]